VNEFPLELYDQKSSDASARAYHSRSAPGEPHADGPLPSIQSGQHLCRDRQRAKLHVIERGLVVDHIGIAADGAERSHGLASRHHCTQDRGHRVPAPSRDQRRLQPILKRGTIRQPESDDCDHDLPRTNRHPGYAHRPPPNLSLDHRQLFRHRPVGDYPREQWCTAYDVPGRLGLPQRWLDVVAIPLVIGVTAEEDLRRLVAPIEHDISSLSPVDLLDEVV
jgi:hypothetical protein